MLVELLLRPTTFCGAPSGTEVECKFFVSRHQILAVYSLGNTAEPLYFKHFNNEDPAYNERFFFSAQPKLQQNVNKNYFDLTNPGVLKSLL